MRSVPPNFCEASKILCRSYTKLGAPFHAAVKKKNNNKILYSALFRVRLDHILSARLMKSCQSRIRAERQPTSGRWTAYPYSIPNEVVSHPSFYLEKLGVLPFGHRILGTWLRITHFLSCINFDFTLPRVITCATNRVTTFVWLKLL